MWSSNPETNKLSLTYWALLLRLLLTLAFPWLFIVHLCIEYGKMGDVLCRGDICIRSFVFMKCSIVKEKDRFERLKWLQQVLLVVAVYGGIVRLLVRIPCWHCSVNGQSLPQLFVRSKIWIYCNILILFGHKANATFDPFLTFEFWFRNITQLDLLDMASGTWHVNKFI